MYYQKTDSFDVAIIIGIESIIKSLDFGRKNREITNVSII